MDSRHYASAFDLEERVFLIMERLYKNQNVTLYVDRKGGGSFNKFQKENGLKKNPFWNRTPDVLVLDHDNKHIRVCEVKERNSGGSVDEKFAASKTWEAYWVNQAKKIGYTASYEYFCCEGHKIKKLLWMFRLLKLKVTFVKRK